MPMGDGEGGVEEDVGGESKGKKCEPHPALLFVLHRVSTITHRRGGFTCEGGPTRSHGGLTSYISSPPLPRRRDPGRFIMGFPHSPLIGPSPFLPIRLLNPDKTLSSLSKTIPFPFISPFVKPYPGSILSSFSNHPRQ